MNQKGSKVKNLEKLYYDVVCSITFKNVITISDSGIGCDDFFSLFFRKSLAQFFSAV